MIMDALFKLIDERISKGIKSAPFIQNEICVVEGLTENGLVQVKVLSTSLHITVPNWSGSPVEVGENAQLFYKGNVLSEQTAYIGASANKDSGTKLKLGSVIEKVNTITLGNEETVLGKVQINNYSETLTVSVNLTFQGDESEAGNGLIYIYVDGVSESYVPQFNINNQEYKIISFSIPLDLSIGNHTMEIKGIGEYANLVDGRIYAFGCIDDYENTDENDYVYTISNGIVTIVKYIGNSLCPRIPDKIENANVQVINAGSFTNTLIERIYIPEGVEEIQ